jgi:predicted RNase H-like nuclease
VTALAATKPVLAAGADGCRSGWVLARRLADGALDVQICRSFSEVLARVPTGPLAVDMPVGLPRAGDRAGDRLARALLGPRRSSVFPAPCRAVLRAGSYIDACAISRTTTGKAISREAWNILAKIAEVDAVVTPALQQRIIEAHPELCFTMMQDGAPPVASKKAPSGRREREELLRSRLYGCTPILAAPRPRGAAADDLLDALAVLWTAERYRCGVAQALTDPAAVDERGLRMAIWY